MDQYHSQLAHHILELAPQLDLPVLLIIDAPFPTFVHHMSLAPLSRIGSEQGGLWEDKLYR